MAHSDSDEGCLQNIYIPYEKRFSLLFYFTLTTFLYINKELSKPKSFSLDLSLGFYDFKHNYYLQRFIYIAQKNYYISFYPTPKSKYY